MQEMLPSGAIAKLYGQFHENLINKNDLSLPQDAIRIYVDATSDGSSNLFRWRWSGIQQIETLPHLRTRPTPGGGQVPDPFPCSGFVYEDGELYQIEACTCCMCWLEEFGDEAAVSDNQFTNAKIFNKEVIATLPYTATRFMRRYHIKVEQLSLSPEVYDFWRMIEKQQNSASDIFQPNSISIKGNITCVTDPEEVLGVFAVSAVTEKSFFIPFELTRRRIALDTIALPCVAAYPGATYVKPPFW
jgi:hypothetical protein